MDKDGDVKVLAVHWPREILFDHRGELRKKLRLIDRV